MNLVLDILFKNDGLSVFCGLLPSSSCVLFTFRVTVCFCALCRRAGRAVYAAAGLNIMKMERVKSVVHVSQEGKEDSMSMYCTTLVQIGYVATVCRGYAIHVTCYM